MLATQQTAKSQSAVALSALDGNSGSSSALSDPPSISKQNDGEARVCLQSEAGLAISSSQATASKNDPNSSALQAATDLDPLGTSNLSPRAVRIYEQSVLSGRASSIPPASQASAGEALVEEIPTKKASLTIAPASQDYIDTNNATTPPAMLPEASSTALATVPVSSRTDGSFRYRHRDQRTKGPSLPRSKLSGPSYARNDTAESQSPGEGIAPKAPLIERGTPEPSPNVSSADREVPEPSCGRKSPEAFMAGTLEATREAVAVASGVESRETHADASPLDPYQSKQSSDSQAAEHDQFNEEDTAETNSQIDGPTLVPSGSSFLSEYSSIPSFGQFSSDKLSEELTESVGLPRRLLWPKSQRSVKRGSLSVLSFRSEHTPKHQQHAPVGPDLCHSAPPNHRRHTDEITPIQTAPEAQTPAIVQEDGSVIGSQEAECHAENRPEAAMEGETEIEGKDEDVQNTKQLQKGAGAEIEVQDDVETESEGEDEEVQDTKQLQTGAGTKPDTQDDANTEMQAPSPVPVPEIQSPWAGKDTALLPSKMADPNSSGCGENAETADTKTSPPPRATQSPWKNEADTVAVDLGTPQQPLFPGPGNAKLALVASQALGQAASQSPWARGDSQIPFPEPRLFNPLSSPANSSVLPIATDGLPQPQEVPHGEDIDMCNSQLYPPHPSTPETKRSGLPTPDFSLSVKSFKDFMTPSPQPAAKRRRISTDDHLPSTQALVDAAISNPWAKTLSTKSTKPKKRKQKRVSWALLPDEEEEPSTPAINPNTTTTVDSPYGAELPYAEPTRVPKPPPHHRSSRTASPPPSILATAALPARDEKFAKHFAAVLASRRHSIGTPRVQQLKRGMERVKKVSLLPSASQQVCGSPAFEAMAEAFLMADQGGLLKAGEGVEMEGVVGDDDTAGLVREEEEDNMRIDGEEMEVDLEQEKEEDEEMQERVEEDEGKEMSQVDDVSAVMQNLDDFLGSWDLDAELVKARAGRERESHGGDRELGVGMSGLMDVGVWD